MNGGSISKFPTEIDGWLKSNRVNRAEITKDSLLVIGSILDGIYAIDMRGKPRWHYNIETGLLNNSVLRLLCDRDNNIWAALDNGIALIHTGSPYTIMIPERGEPTLGMIYELGIAGNSMYIATNQGLYDYSMPNGNIRLVDNTGGQNWHVSGFDRQIFVGNNRHTLFNVDGGAFQPIAGTASSSTCMKECTINGQKILLEATYTKFRIYRKIDGLWRLSGSVDGFMAPLKQIEVDHSGTIWAANMNRGVYRIELSTDLSKVDKVEYMKNYGNSTASLNYVMKIRGRIVLSDGVQLYTYDDMQQQIIPYSDLNNGLESTTDIHSATTVDNNTFWLSGKYGYALMRYENNRFVTLHYVPVSFFSLQNNESNDKVYCHGNSTYFNMNNGIARLEQAKARQYYSVPKLSITAAFTTKESGNIQLPIDPEANPNVGNGLSLQFGFPNYGSQAYTFVFELEGSEKIATTSKTPDVSFYDLSFGSYKITASAINPNGKAVSRCEYAFTVPKPIYLSTTAIIAYVLIAGASVYSISKWRTDKALKKKNKEYEIEKNKQDIKMLEQEKLITLQKQQLLEAELSAKSKEVASLSLDVVAKNQAIEGLRKSMYTQKLKGGISQKDMDLMLKQIESGAGNPEFWNIYQKNFDLIHENFFRNLRKNYPTLTPGDLKFCALLRLNLSTKDIAKFTNLTIRGVEAARYRIRKKLNLPEKASLIEFLIDFKPPSETKQ